MTASYNFSAGPAVLPRVVLERAREELVDWRGSGFSVMEMSHRGEAFTSIAQAAEARLRELLEIPDDYRVLFLQGGATAQFSAVPLNLMARTGQADYADTGLWSKKAIAEARRFGGVNVVASSADTGYRHIPPVEEWTRNASAAYLHYTPNETIGGVEFHHVPDSDGVPLVADMSSTILSRPLDVSRFGLIYAGAQKNMGIAGLTVVIARDDLLGHAAPDTPSLLDYKGQADAGSMSNTPPTFAWYMAGLVFDWIKEQGGLAGMAAHNRRKAEKLYAQIDASGFYSNPIDPQCRSRMNVPFTLADNALDAVFLERSRSAGLMELKGHRSVGGMRASLYNAMPEAGVDALIEFMQDFERRHG